MRVGVDGRHLRASAGRGVARYTELLLGALAREFPQDGWTALVPGGAERPPPGVELRGGRLPRQPLFAAAALAGRPRLDRLAGGCDVAWVPAPAPVAVSAGVPLVLTVHDLSFEHRPADYGRYERLWHRLARPRRLARRATRVIAVSETVRAQLLDEWGLPPERVVTVHSGPGRPPAGADAPAAPAGLPDAYAPDAPAGLPDAYAPDAPADLPDAYALAADAPDAPAGLPDAYVLAAGALEPRKRPLLLAEAHALARERGLRAGLVFAGEGPLRAALERRGATVLGRVSDVTLDALYRHAMALACVSREEGFGLTPLEAAARGTPAIVSELPIFRETLGDAALRVPPEDAGALADALLRLERDPELRARLAVAGAEAAGRLSWERAARETHAVLVEASREAGA